MRTMPANGHPLDEADRAAMDAAFAQAEKSFSEGGIPVGSVLSRGPDILAIGHNRRVQSGDPIAHGEMDCLRSAGRMPSYRGLTLFTTLTPA